MAIEKEEEFDQLIRDVDALLQDPPMAEQPQEIPENPQEPGPQEELWQTPETESFSSGPNPGRGTQASIPAYNADLTDDGFSKLAPPPKPPKPKKPASQAAKQQKKENTMRPKRRHHWLRNTLLILLVLCIGFAAFVFMSSKQPVSALSEMPRKTGTSAILLCGTDEEGYRTDTMMLLYVNVPEKQVNLVSIPRDTLTYTTSGDYAKLNSAFGRNNGAEDPEEGMHWLLDYVKDIIGFQPDGYILIDLDAFVQLVDDMGDITTDVPMDMFYEDPTQDLYIDLKEGTQHLNGYEAMGLVRLRSGYATADSGRGEVQRGFIQDCMEQWLTIPKLPRLFHALQNFENNVVTDLEFRNYVWLGTSILRAGLSNTEMAVLPGYPDMVDGASCYILYPEDVLDLVNTYCNPYQTEITWEDINIAS